MDEECRRLRVRNDAVCTGADVSNLCLCIVWVYTYVHKPARSISAGNAGPSMLVRHASFQFFGVNLSTITLKASWVMLASTRRLPSPGTY